MAALETRIVDMRPELCDATPEDGCAPRPAMGRTCEPQPRSPRSCLRTPSPIIGSVIGTGLAVGISLAVLILRSTSRLDADRREVQRRFDAAMDTFRTEMQRLAER